ncbi:uncharacterized protein G2W53_023049 [Senna tora]|uniref:Uncharacterized protein n=1 Tax=Senna tora TaxID=362788 RepID=A0A834TQU6_9FABA|nr:uncharacterized protein G2W53_023049 [Senna tora]
MDKKYYPKMKIREVKGNGK